MDEFVVVIYWMSLFVVRYRPLHFVVVVRTRPVPKCLQTSHQRDMQAFACTIQLVKVNGDRLLAAFRGH